MLAKGLSRFERLSQSTRHRTGDMAHETVLGTKATRHAGDGNGAQAEEEKAGTGSGSS
jgi:hypothetical protein